MATAKTSTRKKRVSGPAKLTKTKKFAGKTYTKSSCAKLKTAATKVAKAARAKGKNARVVKNPLGGFCVYTRGAARKTKAA